MSHFGRFYLDKEKDIIVDLSRTDEVLSYVLRTPNHRTGNLITNFASLCRLPISYDESGLKMERAREALNYTMSANEVYESNLEYHMRVVEDR